MLKNFVYLNLLIAIIFLTHQFKHVFCVLKKNLLLFRNKIKKNNFLSYTIICRPADHTSSPGWDNKGEIRIFKPR